MVLKIAFHRSKRCDSKSKWKIVARYEEREDDVRSCSGGDIRPVAVVFAYSFQ